MVNRLPPKSELAAGPKPRYSPPVQYFRLDVYKRQYVGNIMDLCTARRGEFQDMVYLDSTRVELHYEMPLNEIIYDFFDALKSRTREMCIRDRW